MERGIIDVYDRSIFEMRNVFTAEECQAFIDYHKKNPNTTNGQVIELGTGKRIINHKVKKTTDVGLDPYNKLINIFIEGVQKVFINYMKHLDVINREECGLRLFARSEIQAPNIQRVDKGGYFNWHTDYTEDPNEQRILAIIVYLNDIDEENGGSTEFNSGRKVQPEAGKVLIFPTSDLHLHRGNTIIDGNSKYIMTNFLTRPNDPVPKQNDFPFIFH